MHGENMYPSLGVSTTVAYTSTYKCHKFGRFMLVAFLCISMSNKTVQYCRCNYCFLEQTRRHLTLGCFFSPNCNWKCKTFDFNSQSHQGRKLWTPVPKTKGAECNEYKKIRDQIQKIQVCEKKTAPSTFPRSDIYVTNLINWTGLLAVMVISGS